MITTVTVYSGPGCTRCQVTKAQFRKLGIAFVEAEAADHPEIIETVESLGLVRQLPVVVIDQEAGEQMVWTGLDRDGIKALHYLVLCEKDGAA
jgi:glutaredoxin